jgi:hypothetical protein
VADFYQRRDVSLVTAFTDPNSKFEFLFESYEQLVFNESNIAVEVSFDGVNVHARCNSTGPSAVIHWSEHIRRFLWVRRESGSGGGAKMVQVLATTR